MDHLLSEIGRDHSPAPINTLCKCGGDQVVFMSLKSALPLDEIMVKFDIMKSTQSSLFTEIWQRHMKNAAASVKRKERVELTIKDIKTVIWEPAFSECKHLLDSLRDRSIKLREVDYYFKSIQQDMSWQLKSVYNGVNKCINPNFTQSSLWIDDVVQHMQEYWSLLTLSKAASVVITLKEKLCLTGDFKAIETLVNQVSIVWI